MKVPTSPRVVDAAVNLELGELSKLRGKYYGLILKAVTFSAKSIGDLQICKGEQRLVLKRLVQRVAH
jgi:hypothetical protein